MHVVAHLDVDVLAVETEGQVSVLVEFTAPTPSGDGDGQPPSTFQAVSMLVRVTPPVRAVQLLDDLPGTTTADGILVELGSFDAGEVRRARLVFDVPGIAAPGKTEVATLTFTYVELPALKQHTTTVPIHIDIVPGQVS